MSTDINIYNIFLKSKKDSKIDTNITNIQLKTTTKNQLLWIPDYKKNTFILGILSRKTAWNWKLCLKII